MVLRHKRIYADPLLESLFQEESTRLNQSKSWRDITICDMTGLLLFAYFSFLLMQIGYLVITLKENIAKRAILKKTKPNVTGQEVAKT